MQEHESSSSYEQAESSFTERYINETSVSERRNTPAARSGKKAVTVSVPYGEESGGLLESIRKMMGRSVPAEPDPETLQWNESPIYEPVSGEESASEEMKHLRAGWRG